MARVLPMPEVAAATTEAVLSEWLVAEGAQVSAGDPIATVETEKALVDIEAEADGVVLTLLVPGSATVEVGSPIAVLGDVGEQVDDLAALLRELGVEKAGDSGPDDGPDDGPGDGSGEEPGAAPASASEAPEPADVVEPQQPPPDVSSPARWPGRSPRTTASRWSS